MARVFLLSPASASGRRAEIVLREAAQFDLAVRLRRQSVSIGEVMFRMVGLPGVEPRRVPRARRSG